MRIRIKIRKNPIPTAFLRIDGYTFLERTTSGRYAYKRAPNYVEGDPKMGLTLEYCLSRPNQFYPVYK